MTWALCIAAWCLLSVPVACLAVRLFRDDPTPAGTVAGAFPPTNSGARRTAPNANATPARVTFNG